ncbi:hypothetical protein BDP55DRAFT_89212 [Colletotrichum godetiae]|uniref:Uncharacterized protein n=1 Tax=Colletotrichum godetiae TaxID=1209918 RepID=A0AAJ0EPM1_9PEZI|nr:uncharacterized protein BDP55DRAFT_89212 [Colletotrichum godetiae]KAK1656613.1 hypothetical protein BDP55DRAFT_89212 [Colletotrichum godetiae]
MRTSALFVGHGAPHSHLSGTALVSLPCRSVLLATTLIASSFFRVGFDQRYGVAEPSTPTDEVQGLRLFSFSCAALLFQLGLCSITPLGSDHALRFFPFCHLRLVRGRVKGPFLTTTPRHILDNTLVRSISLPSHAHPLLTIPLSAAPDTRQFSVFNFRVFGWRLLLLLLASSARGKKDRCLVFIFDPPQDNIQHGNTRSLAP